MELRKMKGQVQLVGLFIAAIVGAITVAFAANSLARSLPKLAFIGLGVFTSYIAYQRITEHKQLDLVTVGLLIGAVMLVLLAFAGAKLLGLEAVIPR